MKRIERFLSIFASFVLLFGAIPALPVQADVVPAESASELGEGPDQPFVEITPLSIGFLVDADRDQIYTYHWALGASVTATINDPKTKDAVDYSTSATVVDENTGYTTLIFDFKDIYDIKPGFEITLTDGVTIKTHTVTELTVTSVDTDTDVVTGVAARNSQLSIWGCWEDGCNGSREEVADKKGNWSADFADDSQVTYDLAPGSWIVASQWDDDSDGTLAGWVVAGIAPEPVVDSEPEATASPVLVAPLNGETLTTNMPTFQWQETAGAVGYQLNLINSNGDDQILDTYEVGIDVICADGICSLDPAAALPNDTYEWLVYPWIDDIGNGYASFTFTVDVPLPDPAGERVKETNDEVDSNQFDTADAIPDYIWEEVYYSGWLNSEGPGLNLTPLIADKDLENPVGFARVWNTPYELRIQTQAEGDWLIKGIQVFVGTEPVTVNKPGNPIPGQFPYKQEFATPIDGTKLVLSFEDDMGFNWGEPWEDMRTQNIAIHTDMVKLDAFGRTIEQAGSWAFGSNEFEGAQWGWWFTYEMAHPKRGHLIDSPVEGVNAITPTYNSKTDVSGGFDYFPGETVYFSVGSVRLGTALAEHKVSPLDIYGDADLEDPRVINMARFLQSLDVDAAPQAGISISDDVVACLDQTMLALGLTGLDFANDTQVDAVIQGTISACDGLVALTSVPAADAIDNLNRSVNSNMFRKNISRTPELPSSKSKLNIMGVWFPALRANDEATSVEYYDENGLLIREAGEAKPVIVVYTDGVEATGAEDIFAGISRDDGSTFKRMNLSRAADISSFTLENGAPYYGDAKKPVFSVQGNNILVAWTSKFCNGGRPAYAIDPEDDYLYDDPYYQGDTWGVGGPQRSVDYTELGHPEVGEIPYSCVWVARGTLVTEEMIASGGFWANKTLGDIVWFKPERLTSGRRDANQIFMGGADGAGFAITWQEDPEGLRPGDGAGPGEGWSGATVSHKTDIWYSYIPMADFSTVDTNFVSNGDPEHELDVTGRPKALVPMGMPMRITDNDAVNTDNLSVVLDGDGYPVLDADGKFIPTDSVLATTDTSMISYEPENLTRCVKFDGDETIVEKDSLEEATYHALPTLNEDHLASMNCTNCHVPYGLEPHSADAPTQKSPIPLLVLDAEAHEYLGGFTNADCVSCHFNNVVPRDRLIPVTPGLDESVKEAECGSKGGTWNIHLEAYYPYEGYPYIPAVEDDSVGTHNYAYEVPGLCEGFYEFTNNQGAVKHVCITADGRLLDGDTGAARPNVFLQAYTKPDGSKSAWAMIAYEETKGIGLGNPNHVPDEGPYGDEASPDVGKNVIYHSFDFQHPTAVSSGDILNMPERNENGELVYVVDPSTGEQLLDYLGQPQLAYENARRPRFVLQGKSAIETSRTVMIVLYREGQEGSGRPADTMLRRVVAPASGNPYAFANFVCDERRTAANGQEICVDGAQNMSSVTPTVMTPSTGDPIADDPYGAVKVVQWQQSANNVHDSSSANPYDDARAHRGIIRGDFIVMGFSYTPNWAAARNGNDKYDFYIRRSFDGGQTWTTDPVGSGVTFCDTFTDPITKEKEEVCNDYGPGAFEQMRNLSQLPNNKYTVIEPRIVAPPGTIKDPETGAWTGRPEDKQNKNVFYVSYGTSTNPKKDPVTGQQDLPYPVDLYYSFSMDKGEHYAEEAWYINPTSDGLLGGQAIYRWNYMAKGEEQQGEAQLRMTPDGTRFYMTWLQEGNGSSDIMFRRIMPPEFLANNAP